MVGGSMYSHGGMNIMWTHHMLHYRYTACLVSLIHTTHCCTFSLPVFTFLLIAVVHCRFTSCQVMHSCKFFYLSKLFIPPSLITLYVWQSCHASVVCIWSCLHISCCHTYHGKCTAQNKLFKRTWCCFNNFWHCALHCIQCWLGARVIYVPISYYCLQHCDNDSTAVHYVTLDVHWRLKLKL